VPPRRESATPASLCWPAREETREGTRIESGAFWLINTRVNSNNDLCIFHETDYNVPRLNFETAYTYTYITRIFCAPYDRTVKKDEKREPRATWGIDPGTWIIRFHIDLRMTGLRSCARILAPEFRNSGAYANGTAAAICAAIGALAEICLTARPA